MGGIVTGHRARSDALIELSGSREQAKPDQGIQSDDTHPGFTPGFPIAVHASG
jgi:hypothetical protein